MKDMRELESKACLLLQENMFLDGNKFTKYMIIACT